MQNKERRRGKNIHQERAKPGPKCGAHEMLRREWAAKRANEENVKPASRPKMWRQTVKPQTCWPTRLLGQIMRCDLEMGVNCTTWRAFYCRNNNDDDRAARRRRRHYQKAKRTPAPSIKAEATTTTSAIPKAASTQAEPSSSKKSKHNRLTGKAKAALLLLYWRSSSLVTMIVAVVAAATAADVAGRRLLGIGIGIGIGWLLLLLLRWLYLCAVVCISFPWRGLCVCV